MNEMGYSLKEMNEMDLWFAQNKCGGLWSEGNEI